MAGKIIVQWQNSYSVGVSPIDDQHIELIRLINKLFNSCMDSQKRDSGSFLNVVYETIEYTNYHFDTEDKIMERINYPDFANHKQKHNDFVREVYTKIDEFKDGKMSSPLQFVYYFRDWILHHIAVSDKKLGSYLLLLKRNGYLQKIALGTRKGRTTNRMLSA